MSSDASNSNNSVPGVVPEVAMDTSSPIPKRSHQEPSANLAEPPSKHQRLVRTAEVDDITLYMLDEQWEIDPDGGDEHLEAQWDDIDDEVDWSLASNYSAQGSFMIDDSVIRPGRGEPIWFVKNSRFGTQIGPMSIPHQQILLGVE